jgi:hypothetical protein
MERKDKDLQLFAVLVARFPRLVVCVRIQLHVARELD